MKRVYLSGAIALVLALVSVEARAQAGILRGKVLDDQGQALEGAKVEIDYQGGVTKHYEVKVSKKGDYTQVGLAPGNYKLAASKEGFQTQTLELRVGIGDPTEPAPFKLIPVSKVQKAGGGNAAGDALVAGFKDVVELAKASKWDEAEAKDKELIAKNPAVPELQYELGYLQSQKKDWAGAEAAYKKTLELKPDFTDAILGLAGVYRATGREAEATALMGKASTDFATDPKVQFQMAVTAFNTGKSDEAIAAFNKVVESDPTNADAHFYLGSLLVGQNKVPEAIQHLEKYLSMNPPAGQNRQTAEGLLAALKPKK
jgi:tetratricopeptide (TPR) repeat protein